MDPSVISTDLVRLCPPDGAGAGSASETCDLPPSLRHLVRALLARGQIAGLRRDELAPVRALLRRRRGDDDDRLEAAAFARVGRGDEEAFAWVVARYSVVLRLLATAVRGESADDSLQEAQVKLWRSAARFDPARGPVAAWVLAVAHHALFDERRRHTRMCRRRARAEPLLRNDVPDAPCPDGAEDFERAHAAVEALDPLLREVLLASAHDRSHAEVAAALGLPVGTVKTRIRRAQRQLRAALDAAG